MNSSNAMKKGRFEAARLRGKDLNLRPLGYEGNGNSHRNPHQPTNPNNDAAFSGSALGWFGFL